MSPRADEHEGVLNDTAVKRESDQMNAEARKILTEDLLMFTESEAFLRWFGKYAVPAMTQDFPVNNGSQLAEFMGRRQVVIEIIKEMDDVSPGFVKRIFEVREKYDNRLRHAAQVRD